MLYGDNGVRWTSSHSNEASNGSDSLWVLYNSMMRDHLENLNDLAPWFAQLSDSRRMDYQNHLLKETDGNVQRYLAYFNNEWEDWVEDLGDEYEADLIAAEMRRASASLSYTAAGVAFAVFLAVMFMSLIAFIERNTSKIANR